MARGRITRTGVELRLDIVAAGSPASYLDQPTVSDQPTRSACQSTALPRAATGGKQTRLSDERSTVVLRMRM